MTATPDQIAKMIEGLSMPDILLHLGEMTAQERRTVKALKSFIAHRVRTMGDHL